MTTDSSEKAEMDLLSPSREKFEVELWVDMRMGVGGVLPRGGERHLSHGAAFVWPLSYRWVADQSLIVDQVNPK